MTLVDSEDHLNLLNATISFQNVREKEKIPLYLSLQWGEVDF